jgi:hypothetical protein
MNETKKAATIFDHISHLTDKKVKWDNLSDADKKSFSPFIVNRWLSMNEDFVELINLFQRYTIGQLSPSETYKLYSDLLPKNKQYLKYVKGKKQNKYNENLVELIAFHYSVSKANAIDYIDVLIETDIESLQNIIKKYGKTDAEVTKLLKKEK